MSRPVTLSILVVIDRMVAMSNNVGRFGQAGPPPATRCPATRHLDIRVSAARVPGLSLARLSGLPATRLCPAGLCRRPATGTPALRHPAEAADPDRDPQRGGRLHPGQSQGDAGATTIVVVIAQIIGLILQVGPLAAIGELGVLRGEEASTAAALGSSASAWPARSPHCCRRSCSAAC